MTARACGHTAPWAGEPRAGDCQFGLRWSCLGCTTEALHETACTGCRRSCTSSSRPVYTNTQMPLPPQHTSRQGFGRTENQSRAGGIMESRRVPRTHACGCLVRHGGLKAVKYSSLIRPCLFRGPRGLIGKKAKQLNSRHVSPFVRYCWHLTPILLAHSICSATPRLVQIGRSQACVRAILTPCVQCAYTVFPST